MYFGIPFVDGKGEEYPVTGFSYPCNPKGTTDKIIELSGMKSALSDSVLQNAAGIGHIANVETRVINRIPLIVRYQGKLYPSLVLQIAGDYFCKSLHIPKEQLEIVITKDYISLRKKRTKDLLCQIPVDEKCQMLINFAETTKDSFAFRVRSIRDVLNLPASKELKGKIVLAGGVTNTTGDMYTAPFAIYPGVGILSNALENIIDNRFLHQPLKGVGFFLFPILTVLIGWGMSGKRLKWQIWVAIAGVVVYLIGVWCCFEYGVWLELLRPIVVWSGVMGWMMIEGKRELEKEVQKKEEEKRLLEIKIRENEEEISKLHSEINISQKNGAAETQQLNARIQELEDEDKRLRNKPLNGLRISLNGNKATISFREETVYISKGQALLLRHVIQEQNRKNTGVHWVWGCFIFTGWVNHLPKDPKNTFSQQIDELNKTFGKMLKKLEKEGNIKEKIKIIGSCKGDTHPFLLAQSNSEYECNISKAFQYVREASELLDKNDLKGALDTVYNAISEDTENVEAYMKLLDIYMESKKAVKEESMRDAGEKLNSVVKKYDKCIKTIILSEYGKIDSVKDELKTMKNRRGVIAAYLSRIDWGKKEKSQEQDPVFVEILGLMEKVRNEDHNAFDQLREYEYIKEILKTVENIISRENPEIDRNEPNERNELKNTVLSLFWTVLTGTWDKDRCTDIKLLKSYFIESVKRQVCEMLINREYQLITQEEMERL